MRRSLLAATGVALAAVLLLGGAMTASAYEDGDPSNDPDDGPPGPAAQIQIVDVRLGSTVRGEIGTAPVNPTVYPAAPATGVDRFAAIIGVRDALDRSAPVTDAYCVNLRTSTGLGIEYSAADWNSNVANPNYIQYILNTYYPLTAEPLAAGSDSEKVAAVQSAIWFFSDGWVLTNARPAVRTLTEGIVADAILNGAGYAPPSAPTLTFDPAAGQAPSDTRVDGPFRISGTATGITIRTISPGLGVFADAGRTQPLAVGSPVTLGQDLWLGTVQSPSSSLTLDAEFDTAVGTLYLSDAGPNAYQKIVLAQRVDLPVRANLVAAVYAANSATLRKTIAGTGAGRQGEVRVELVCDQPVPTGTGTTLTVPARAAAGSYELVVTGIPVGATCRAEERANGVNDAVTLESTSVTPASLVIPETGPSEITVTDRYALARVLPVTGAPDLAGAALAGMGLIALGALAMVVRRAGRRGRRA